MWTSGNKEKIELKRYKTKWEDSGRKTQIILRGSYDYTNREDKIKRFCANI